jgi:TRAP transporter 4TM/12TM fusion protein
MRKYRGWAAAVITAIACLMSIFHLYTGLVITFPAQIQRGIHLCLGLMLIFILVPPSKKEAFVNSKLCLAIDLILAGLSFAISYYYIDTIEAMLQRQGLPNTADIVMSTIAIVLVLESARRTIGPVLAMITSFFIVYAIFGEYFPDLVSHGGMNWEWLSTFLYLSTEGIYGIPIGVTATFVFLFVLFTNAIRESGGDILIADMAASFLGRTRGGSAKASVFMGLLIGMISGSPVADAAAVGSLTIPLMKKKGFSPIFAASLTAISANGGAFMPPVMGAAAFIMVEFINWNYWSICGAAILPALLYYFACYMAADLEAAKRGIRGIPREERPLLGDVLKRSFLIVVPFIALLVSLGVLNTTPQRAAAVAFVTLVLVYVAQQVFFRKMNATVFFKYLIRVFESGTKSMLTIISTCACAGMVVGIINITGLGMQLSSIMVDLSGGQLLPLLLLTMIASLILGMGLPVTACYIILAVLAAPALIQAGVTPIGAHLFVFYFGIVSGLTPPVALTAYVAAGIAHTPVFRTGVYSFLIALVAFLVPYVWIYEPSLIFQGPFANTILYFLLCAVSIISLAAGVMGYLFTSANIPERTMFFIAGLAIIIPETISTIAGIALLAVTAAFNFVKRKKTKEHAATVQKGDE